MRRITKGASGFKRVRLKKEASDRVSVVLSREHLQFLVTGSGWIVEPGGSADAFLLGARSLLYSLFEASMVAELWQLSRGYALFFRNFVGVIPTSLVNERMKWWRPEKPHSKATVSIVWSVFRSRCFA